MATPGEFLTPQELAEALKISTYTAYELIKRGEVAAVRVGRQLRVPAEELQRYTAVGTGTAESGQKRGQQRDSIERSAQNVAITGSHDPSIEILVSLLRKASPALRVTTSFVGSLEGLISLFHQEATVAAAHLWEADGPTRAQYLGHVLPNHTLTVLRVCLRSMGLGTAPGNPLGIERLEDIARGGIRFINRQRGSGTRVRFEHMLQDRGINASNVVGFDDAVDTHHAVALAVQSGQADVGLLCETAARASGLYYTELYREPYDLVFRTSLEDTEPVSSIIKTIINIIRSREFLSRLQALGGYDTGQTGQLWRLQT